MIIQKPKDEIHAGEPAPSQQQVPAPPAGSIYSDDEVRVLGPWQRIRQLVFSPIAFGLARLGISPDALSFTSLALSIGFCLLAPINFTVAFWLLVASFIIDGLDGVEARLTKTNSAKGAFTDTCCDQAALAFSVAGMAWIGAIKPALAVLYVYAYTALVLFLVLHRFLRVSSRWIIRPGRSLFYILIALDFFFHINLLNYLLLIYLLALPLLAISFWRLRKAF